MAPMTHPVVGLFPTHVAAEHAIVDLRAAGFDTNRMGIIMRDRSDAHDDAEGQVTQSTLGAVTGGLLGGTAGALAAATGAFIIPGIGPFISGGILATTLVTGAAGWLVGGLVGFGIPSGEAEYYQGQVEQGRVLLVAEVPEGHENDAWRLMLQNGAEDARHGASSTKSSAPVTSSSITLDEDILAERPGKAISSEQDEPPPATS